MPEVPGTHRLGERRSPRGAAFRRDERPATLPPGWNRFGDLAVGDGRGAPGEREPGGLVGVQVVPSAIRPRRDGGRAVEPRTTSSTGGSLASGGSVSGFSMACTSSPIPPRAAASKG